MRLSVNFILVLLACSLLELDVVGDQKAEKSAKSRQQLDQVKLRANQGDKKIVTKGDAGSSEEASGSSHEEAKLKVKQKTKAKDPNSSEEDEKEESTKNRWNLNFKNHKDNHVEKITKIRFTNFHLSGKNKPKKDVLEEEMGENKGRKIGNEDTKRIDVEGLKKFLKSKNEKNVNDVERFVKRTHKGNAEANEEKKIKAVVRNKHLESSSRPFQNVKKFTEVKVKAKSLKIEKGKDHGEDNHNNKDDIRLKRNKPEDSSSETEDNLDDPEESKGSDSLQCDSIEEDCDYH